MAGKCRSKRVGPFTSTVKAQYAERSTGDMFVPGWDRSVGEAQGVDHTKQRRRMGQKMTPIGRGTLIKR